MSEILESNMIQLFLTAAFGGVLYVTVSRSLMVIKFFAYAISIGIILSALFNIGEVYIYNSYYKRAFFYFSDEITTIIAVFLLLALAKNYHILSVTLASALLLSGGKVSLILFFIMCCFYVCIHWSEKYHFLIHVWRSLVLGFVGYCSVVAVSNYIDNKNVSDAVKQKMAVIADVNINPKRQSNCTTFAACVSAQVFTALKHRYFTSLAGLWMTMEGGFSGERFPNSPEEFAKLITDANPWGMNDYYNLTYEDWKAMRLVQTPYLAFGAGYGLWILIALLVVFVSISWVAYQNIKAGERDEAVIYSITFLTIFLFNHTQSWLKSGSIVLILLGYTSAHIITFWLIRKKIPPFYTLQYLFPRVSKVRAFS